MGKKNSKTPQSETKVQEDLGSPDFSFEFEADFDLTFSKDRTKGKRPGEATGVGTRQRIVTKAIARRFYDLRGAGCAQALLERLPKPGETIHAIMGGDFHAWDLVPAIHKLLNGPIAELTLTTLGFNHANNQHLCEMIDAGAVRSAHLVCSSYFEGADKDLFNTARERLEARGQRITAVRNHSKVILIAPAASRGRYVLESSANLRSCNNLEQLALTNDAGLFEFHRTWIHSLFR